MIKKFQILKKAVDFCFHRLKGLLLSIIVNYSPLILQIFIEYNSNCIRVTSIFVAVFLINFFKN